MSALWRRRRGHRTPGRAPARRRHTLVVDLPEAPGSLHRPAPLVLLLSPDRPGWQLSGDAKVVAGLAVLLATLDLAPPGALVGLVGDDPVPALLAAVYSTRPVRAVAADGLVAHTARQAASSNALPLVVEERRIAGVGGTSLDEYAATTGLAPAVVHVGAGIDPGAVLAGALGTLTLHRPWLVVTGDVRPEQALAAAPHSAALDYRLATEGQVAGHEGLYVLAPEGAPAGLDDGLRSWSRVLASVQVRAPVPAVHPAAGGVVDLRPGEQPARPR